MNAVFNKLAQAEKDFKESEFVAPIISSSVMVNIAGVILKYGVRPSNFQGWAILKPMASKLARVVGEPSTRLKNQYLEALPKFYFCVCDVENNLGMITNSDNRISFAGPFKFFLSENIRLFDSIEVRFDGQNFLYYRRNRHAANRIVGRLQRLLDNNKQPKEVQYSKGYQEAYEYAFGKKQKELYGNKEYQIKSRIERAGGRYISFDDLGNNEVRVSYTVQGQIFNTTLNKDLGVISAGICLSGGDTLQDLQSLVHVIKEGQNSHQIVVGDYSRYYD